MQILAQPSATPSDCPPGPPPELRTLVEIARWRARWQADAAAFVFLADGEEQEQILTYGELDRRACRLAAELASRGLRGQRVLLAMNPGLEYNTAIFGCLYAGAVAVPVYPPDAFRAHRILPRLQAIVRDAEAALVLSSAEILSWIGSLIETQCGAATLAVDGAERSGAAADSAGSSPPCPARTVIADDLDFPLGGDVGDLAFLQYTSGSTGEPKGVMLTHGNVMHNLAALHRLDKPGATAVSWLPPYHDMGLIGGILLPVHSGRPVVLMSPLAFVQRPVRWLRAISRYRACTTAAPNFGYELCLRKIREEECGGLDLSCWVAAINGAEPVQADTLDRFAERFAPYGFRREAFYPAFGMAEATLLVSGGCRGEGPLSVFVSAPALERGRVEETPSGGNGARRLVGCGQPIPGGEILVVDPHTRRALGPGAVGEIWVRSPSVALGYWNRPQETEEVFRARLASPAGPPCEAAADGVQTPSGVENGPPKTYLRTGDLGFIHRGHLFIAGRCKELIILGGRNFYPHDVERTVQRAHPALKSDGGAAFSVECDGQERLVVVHEVLRPKGLDLQAILRDIRRELIDEYDWPPHAVVLIAAGTLPKTSSGKTRRNACRQMFLRGELTALAEWREAESPGPQGEPPEAAETLATPLERKIARLWGEVLGVEPSKRGDDFFAFGGQSLRAGQLAARLSEEFATQVPMAMLFERPTIAQQAKWLEGASPAGAEGRQGDGRCPAARATAPATIAGDPRNPRPTVLSCSEERLWFLDQLQPGHPFYNMPAAVRVRGPLDAERLRVAVNELAARHEILRTTFPSDRGRPFRRIAASAEIPFRFMDFEQLPPDEREAALQQCLRSEAARPFDLANGPLLRCLVGRLGARDHVVLLAMHHIICDGWSLGLLLGELRDLCAASDGQAARANRPALRIEYADYAAWQQQRAASGDFEEQLAFWQRHLGGDSPAGAVPPLELPTDRPRSARQDFAGALRTLQVPPDALAAIDALARGERTTRFAVLLAAYQALLGRYARQEDFAVGTVMANRPRPELEKIVGFFANTVALRADLSGDPSFRQLVGRVHRTALEAHAHQEVPFGKVVERLQPERCGNRPPLFQAALVLENMPLDLQAGGFWEVERVAVDTGAAKYEMALLLWEEGNRLRGEVEYSTALFDAATIDGMIDAFGTLLASAAADPDQPISRIPMVSPSLKRRILGDRGAPQTASPGSMRPDRPAAAMPEEPRGDSPAWGECLHQLFERWAAEAPQRTALVCGGRRVSYGELDLLASGVAERLGEHGLRPEEPVTVCLPRSAELVAAMLGVLKAGGVYVPLDPDQPADRIAFLLDDSQSRFLLTRRSEQPRLPPLGATVLVWESLVEDVSRQWRTSGEPRPARGVARSSVGPGALAYILYTSGSTGRPKGALIEHRGVVNFVRAFSRGLGVVPADRVLHCFSPSSDGSLSDIFSALANGACLVVADRETVLTPKALEELAVRERVTVATLTPSMMTLLNPDHLPELRTVCSVGEPISGSLTARWSAGRRLINGYGLTETSIGVSLAELSSPSSRSVLGCPLDNVQVYVLDPHLNLVPVGAVGEICIGGVQVGRGYWNRPELTEARFVPDPFQNHSPGRDGAASSPARAHSGVGSPRLYRTGDLGRLRADGGIELLGRSDDQVKVRGYRVEPGEIAAALEEHPRVEQAAVIFWEERPGEGQLVAYVVPRKAVQGNGGGEPEASALRAHLRQRLPEHMVPRRFVILDELPRSVQGKIDRRRLPPPGSNGAAAATRRPPRDELEALVADVWRQVLGVGEVGCEDDFFALGGHSLLAVRAMSEIEARTGRRLPLAALFQEATVAHLARLLRNPEACPPEHALVPLQPLGKGRPFFCIHPAGGTVFCYRALAERLGTERPFYGIQALGVDGQHAPLARVDDMVAHYIAAIRGVQAHGPYLLGGWSLGGNLAFETARRLSEEGEPIGLLALFDAGALHADRGPTEADFLPMIMALFPHEQNLPLETLRALDPQEQLDFFLRRAVQAEVVADHADFRAGRHVFEVFKTSMEAILAYRQKPFAGKVTLFAAEHREDWFGSRSDPQLGWGAWAGGGVELHPVPGGHLQMVLEPHVAVLAEKLRAVLDRAE